MSTFRAAEILARWDRAQGASPARRPLALLTQGAGDPGLSQLPVGICDTQLLRLREQLFGLRLEARVDCPHCRESLEFALPTEVLRPAEIAPPGVSRHSLCCTEGGWSADFRSPCYPDLEAVSQVPDPDTARWALLERCLVHLRDPDGNLRPLHEAPAELVDAMIACMAAADPAADLRVDLVCPTCQAAWTAPVDPPSLVWAEISWAASRLLREVHELARVYGWTEEAILALTSARRKAYLDLVRE